MEHDTFSINLYRWDQIKTTYDPFKLYPEPYTDNHLGLQDGVIGQALFLFEYSRTHQNKKLEDKAYDLLEKAVEQISMATPLNYINGIWGIGCSLEQLIRNNYIEEDPDELLSEIDKITINTINWRFLKNASLSYGAAGVGYYLYWRIIDRIDNSCVLRLKEHLIYLLNWLETFYPITDSLEKKEVLYFLQQLEPTGFYRSKIRSLINKLN